MMGQGSMGALNFDSPSTAAAMGALGSFDIGLDGVGGLDGLTSAFASEEEKLRRLDTILKLLNVCLLFYYFPYSCSTNPD